MGGEKTSVQSKTKLEFLGEIFSIKKLHNKIENVELPFKSIKRIIMDEDSRFIKTFSNGAAWAVENKTEQKITDEYDFLDLSIISDGKLTTLEKLCSTWIKDIPENIKNLIMQKYESMPEDKQMKGKDFIRNKKLEDACSDILNTFKCLTLISDIPVEDDFFNHTVKIIDEYPNLYSKYGCKLTSAAIMIAIATGKDIDMLDVNEFDADSNGELTKEEILDAFNYYLESGDSVSVTRFTNRRTEDGYFDKFDKQTIDEVTNSDDEVFILGRAANVFGHDHWVVLTGYCINRETKQLEFTYQGSSRNDKGRNFILEKNSLGTDKTYTIDALEVYTVRRGYKVK